MSCVKPYQEEKDELYDSGHGNYLKGIVLKTGEKLHVTQISGTFVNCATTEYVEMGYHNGHAYVPLHKDKPANTSDFVHWKGDLFLREGQCVYVYLADVASGERMKLRAEGRWE